ncbi:MAG: DUF1573 domain-containing protein [Bacteroidia bacterium]
METQKLNTILIIAAIAISGYNTVLLTSSSSASSVSAPATNTTGLTPTPPTNVPQDVPADPTRPTTSLAFAQELHDFGDIKQETTNKHVFEFTNTGVEPLVIENATGSCGCTVPNYPKEPIMPGQKGVIEVEYKPGQQEGPQQKTVTVTANTEPRQTLLKIKANVTK